jgi:hypothetical protein
MTVNTFVLSRSLLTLSPSLGGLSDPRAGDAPRADRVLAPNPVHQEFGRTFCRMDRRVPYGPAATPL